MTWPYKSHIENALYLKIFFCTLGHCSDKFMTTGAGVAVFGRGHMSEYKLGSTLSIYSTARQ